MHACTKGQLTSLVEEGVEASGSLVFKRQRATGTVKNSRVHAPEMKVHDLILSGLAAVVACEGFKVSWHGLRA